MRLPKGSYLKVTVPPLPGKVRPLRLTDYLEPPGRPVGGINTLFKTKYPGLLLGFEVEDEHVSVEIPAAIR